jgi:hypothetical protein
VRLFKQSRLTAQTRNGVGGEEGACGRTAYGTEPDVRVWINGPTMELGQFRFASRPDQGRALVDRAVRYGAFRPKQTWGVFTLLP